MRYFDLHCDTIYELSDMASYTKKRGTLLENRGHVDLQRAAVFDHYAQIFALFCGAKSVISPEDAHQRFIHLLQTAQHAFTACGDRLMHCKTASDWKQAQEQHKTAAFLSIEGAELLQSKEDVQIALEAGIRIVTLTWNHNSIYGCGASTDNTAGLKPQGKKLAQYLSQHGVFMDVSHLSERGFWDLAQCIDEPILATHSNSRVLCPHLRNLTDEQFREIIRRGGLVGINLYVPFIVNNKTADCDDLVRHIEHFCALGGQKNLCIGADWDGCDHMPTDIHDITGMELLAEALARHNYSEQQIIDILYDNAARFVSANF
ncbi:MAG: dipeptidase [Clostridia bacterium]|nr:dipeptidase [Clostridia bacterium]